MAKRKGAMHPSVRWLLLASCLLVFGCRKDAVSPCDLWTASAVVSGRVSNTSGAALSDVAVEVEIAGCDGAEDWTRKTRVVTDASGKYSVELGLGNERGIRCVRVTDVGSGTSSQGQVEFAGGCEDTRPPGQLMVDLVIP